MTCSRIALAAAALAALPFLPGCDSNPDAPTAPPNVIVSDSDSGAKPSQASKKKPKAAAEGEAAPADPAAQ